MVPLHPVLRRHRRFHSDDPPSPLKQAGISPVLCLTTARFRVGVKITKDSWAEVMKMRPRTLTKQHRDSRFQCRVAVQFLPWTSAITWLVVWWTTAALPAGVNTEVGQTPSLKTFFSDANPAKDVATGRYSACGLMVNGNVTCWGTGFLGTGGSGQTANPGVIWPNLGSGRTAVHVELGRKHNCALLDNDAVKCWGDDSYGQMGNGASTSNENTPTACRLLQGSSFKTSLRDNGIRA